MRPFRWCGEWLISSAEHLKVEGFFPTRFNERGHRAFNPALILDVAGNRLLVDGERAILELIDVLVPGLNHAALHAGMRGDFIIDGGPSFADDVRDFIREAGASRLVLEMCAGFKAREPNAQSLPFSGYAVNAVFESAIPRTQFSVPAAWGEVQTTTFPVRFARETVDWLPGIICGDHPRRVVAINLRRGWLFDAGCESLVSSCIYGGPEGLDLRPHATKRVENSLDFKAELTRRIHEMHETQFPDVFMGGKEMQGLLFHEVEDVQRSRWNAHFFSAGEGFQTKKTVLRRA